MRKRERERTTLWHISFSPLSILFNILLILLFLMSWKSVGVRSFVTPGHLRHVEARDPPFANFAERGPVLRYTSHNTSRRSVTTFALARTWLRTTTDDLLIHNQRDLLLLYFLSVFTPGEECVCVSEPKISSAFAGRIIQVGPVAMPYERWVKFNFLYAIWRQCYHFNPEGAKFSSFSTHLAQKFFIWSRRVFWSFLKNVFSCPS